MKKNIKISEELHLAVKQYCDNNKLVINEFVENSVANSLNNIKGKSIDEFIIKIEELHKFMINCISYKNGSTKQTNNKSLSIKNDITNLISPSNKILSDYIINKPKTTTLDDGVEFVPNPQE